LAAMALFGTAAGVNPTEHVLVSPSVGVSTQVLPGEKVAVPPLLVKVTVPDGAGGAALVPLTVAVHVVVVPASTVDGVHDTLVVVTSFPMAGAAATIGATSANTPVRTSADRASRRIFRIAKPPLLVSRRK